MATVAVMTTTMTMNRLIHDAVRRDLDRLTSALGSVADGDSDRARDLDRAFANLRNELTHHHEGEDRWIWPMLANAGIDADLLAAMESEHQAMSEALAETSSAMAGFAATGSASDAAAARESVVGCRTVVEQHLTHEEEDLEPVVIPLFESPEWKQVEKKLSRQPPRVAGPFFAWITDGMSDEGRHRPGLEGRLRLAGWGSRPAKAKFFRLLSRVEACGGRWSLHHMGAPLTDLTVRTQVPTHRAPAHVRRAAAKLHAPIVVALVVLTMLVLVSGLGGWGALVGLALVPMVAAGAWRQRRGKAWQRELEVAFRVHERREVSFSRVL